MKFGAWHYDEDTDSAVWFEIKVEPQILCTVCLTNARKCGLPSSTVPLKIHCAEHEERNNAGK